MDRLLAPLLNKLDVLCDRIANFQGSVDSNTSTIAGLRDDLKIGGIAIVVMFTVALVAWWIKK